MCGQPSFQQSIELQLRQRAGIAPVVGLSTDVGIDGCPTKCVRCEKHVPLALKRILDKTTPPHTLYPPCCARAEVNHEDHRLLTYVFVHSFGSSSQNRCIVLHVFSNGIPVRRR